MLLASPAFILASHIIEQSMGNMTLPSAGQDWPLYVSHMPDSEGVKTNAGALYDTISLNDGSVLSSGEVIQHYGLQLKIRSDTYNTGWAEIEAVSNDLDAVLNAVITVETVDYIINNVKRFGTVVALGAEPGTKKRQVFVANFLVTMKRSV